MKKGLLKKFIIGITVSFFASLPCITCQASVFSPADTIIYAHNDIPGIAIRALETQLSFVEDNFHFSDTVTGWKTIRPQDRAFCAVDYNDDRIGSELTVKELTLGQTFDSADIYSLGMKEYETQGIFIKPLNDNSEIYRLITPNGWKVSESDSSGRIVLEDDDSGANQMWHINTDEAGYFIFTNVKTGHYIDWSDFPNLKASEYPEPVGQQFLLFDRKYTGWNWYFDAEFGKYYLNGEELTDVGHPFYTEGSWGSIYTGLVWNNGDWLYVHLGEPDYSYTGLTYTNNNWWYVSNGTIDRSFTGLTEFNERLWYVSEGKYDTTYNGSAMYNGIYYDVSDGKATFR